MNKRTSRAGAVALAISVTALALTACGGGGGGGGTSASNDGFGPGSPSTCPKAAVADIWINNRLGCLTVGQPFINAGAGATGIKKDRAYQVGQQASDQNFKNLLGGNVSRYFKYYVCIRNAPENLKGQEVASSLADALGIGSALRTLYFPPGVTSSSLSVGGVLDSVVEARCDQAKHPVIVDFNTGKVESVNASALASLQVYDL
jgi:hypothetical protein